MEPNMKIAIISDIHGNIEALEAVLKDIAAEGCAKTYCLGDVVGYGPAPNEACARLRELGIETVQGKQRPWIFRCRRRS
jgi:predicted phosphodiesterase